MPDKVTAPGLASMYRAGKKIVCITAYDSTFGQLADEAGADLVLVGDSVGNVMLGYPTTLPVTLDQMVHHLAATRTGVKRALLVADLPFGSYNESVSQAVASAVVLMKAGAEAVKLEGEYIDEIKALTKAGIPVLGHVGYTPQAAHRFGAAKIQGKGPEGDEILETAQRIWEAGAIAIVLELIPHDLAERITKSVQCPTIGIGAGPNCSGQIQVLHDVLGLSEMRFRHAKQYTPGRALAIEAIRSYSEEVRSGEFMKGDTAS